MQRLISNWSQPQRWLVPAFFSSWIVYFLLFWRKALFTDQFGNLVAGHINIWGDWAAHMTMTTAMAERGLLLESSPFLLGQTFSYPFVSNALSALLINFGLGPISALVIPSFFFSCLTVFALYFFYQKIWQRPTWAVLAATLFLLNGGLGFIYFGQDILSSPQPLTTLLNPPHEYTRLDDQNLKWINVLDSMIIPQRAFTLGFPLTVIALGLLAHYLYLEKTTKLQLAPILLATLILGCLPLIHTHSFLAAFIILSCWTLGKTGQLVWTKEWKKLSTFLQWSLLIAGGTAILAVPLFLTFFFDQTQHFIKWYPGWLAREFEMNWLWFWLKNWSLTPLLALISWFLTARKNPRHLWFWSPFFVLFFISNLWLFQPFSWDNTKLLIWASLGFAGLTAYVLKQLWHQHQRLLAIVLFLSVTLSGAIDSYWILRHDLHSYVMHTAGERQLAEWVSTQTDPTSIWLTGDQHNHWLYNLTGRQSLLTFRGWLWTHGYSYQQTEQDVLKMYAQPQHVQQLFAEYGVDYIVVGPNERQVWGANEPALERLFPVSISDGFYTIYQVTPQPRDAAAPQTD